MTLHHPSPEQIGLSSVLAALGDETRLAIVRCLARHEAADGLMCGQFGGLTSKTNLTYHMAKLREAGVVTVRPEGTKRFITLRREDLDLRFPGLLDSIVAGAADLAVTTTVPKNVEMDSSIGETS